MWKASSTMSDSDSSTERLPNTTPRLHDELGSADIEELHKIFLSKQKMEPHQLREVLRKFGLTFKDDQFRTLFLKV